MAYLNIKLPEEINKDCEFTFSNDIAEEMKTMIKQHLEIPYLQREEINVGDRTILKIPNVPEEMRKLYREGAVRLFLKQGGEISEN